ncbi:DUF3967 domain-containing protein [Priestia megaterium]|uniref:DUF3967 domain-containing protein n=1 Tax=Priestia megaterium TaxID=1404 RepID=A0AAX6BTB5_PRIMG|nr:hypothetical protein [Priestia megaterium]GMG76930.1 DUF3967 domain-containing protein [Priestia megaterium]
MDEQGTTERAYWTKEIADVLQISNSTLRKWCLALENAGYIFDRGANNSRVFYDKDMLLIRRLKELVQYKKMALDTSANLVVSTLEGTRRTAGVREENSDNSSAPMKPMNAQEHVLIGEVLDRLERMEEFNKQLISRLEERDKYIQEQLHKRDERMITSLREMMEAKKEIAASEKAEKEEKKGFWQRLFNRP